MKAAGMKAMMLAALACAAFDTAAVRLDPEGGGQALIYP